MVVLKNPLLSEKALLNKVPAIKKVINVPVVADRVKEPTVKPVVNVPFAKKTVLGRALGEFLPKAATPAEQDNKDKLNADYNSARARILQDPLISAGQRKGRLEDLDKIFLGNERGISETGGILGVAKSVGGAILGGVAKAIPKPVVEGLGYAQRFMGASEQAILQTVAQPFLAGYIPIRQALGADKEQIDSLKNQKKWLDENRVTFDSWLKNINNKEYRLFGTDPENNFISTGNDKLDSVLNFGVEAYNDPLSHVGVGAYGNIGFGGRAGLATEFSTTAMIAKYPVLAEAGVVDKILRLGAAGIPDVVLKGEKIPLGFRFYGSVIPNTQALEIGFAKTFGRTRAAIGDVIYSQTLKKIPVVGAVSNVIGAVGDVTTPKSLKGLREVSGGRGLNLEWKVLTEKMSTFSAERFAKGEFSTTLHSFTRDLLPLLKRQKELSGFGLSNRVKGVATAAVRDSEAKNLYRYVEMSAEDLAVAPITPELRQLAIDVKVWQTSLRETVNQKMLKFGEDYDVNVRPVGNIDDYIFHKMGSEARTWMRSKSGGAAEKAGLFKAADVSVKDLVDPTGPVMFRKLRAPYVNPDTGERVVAEFLGVPIETAEMATIDGLNAISMKELGFNWFDTDMVAITESYAYSMAKAKGRVAFATRMMDYGEDFIKPLIPKIVPDKMLVSRLETTLSDLMAVRAKLRNRVQVNKLIAKEYVAATTEQAKNFLTGEYKKKALTSKEIGILSSKIDETLVKLIDAGNVAQTMSAAARGEFYTVHKVMLDEITRLRAALDNPDYYAAAQELREIYTHMYPNHNPKLLDAKSPEWMAEKILNGRGIPATREIRVITNRLKELRETIDSTPEGPEYVAVRQTLESEYNEIENLEKAFSVLAEVKADADWANDGFVYGQAKHLDNTPLDEGEVKVFRTKPVEGSPSDEVALHAPTTTGGRQGPVSVKDLREGQNFGEFFSSEGIVAGIADSLERKGIPLEYTTMLRDVSKHLEDNLGDIGPYSMLSSTMPEIDELIKTIYNHGSTATVEMSEDIILDALTDVDDLLRLFGRSLDVDAEGVDEFARQIMDDAVSFHATQISNANEFDGVLLPQRWIDEGVEGLEGEWAAIMSNEFAVPEQFRKLTTNPSADVQQVADNQFITDIRSGLYEEKSWETTISKGMKEEEIINLENSQIVSAEARAEIRRLAGQKGGLTRAKNARVTRVEKAQQQLLLTNSVDIEIAGVKKTVTRKEAQAMLTARSQPIEKAELAFDKRIQNIYDRQGIPRMSQSVDDYRERVAMLMDQAKVLKTWSATSGRRLTKEVDDMKMLLKDMPSETAASGEAASWLSRVDRSLISIGGIQDPVLKKAYERVTTLLHADEAALVRLEAINIYGAKSMLEFVEAGGFGRMIEVTEKGWEEIAGLGVQMPEELLANWKPNLSRGKTVLGRQEFYEAYKYTTNFFKVFATTTVGFFARNGFSATFSNFVDGVSVKATKDGFEAARAIGIGAEKGGHWWRHADWEQFLSKQTPADREIYELAWKATETSGRGVTDEFSGLRSGRKFSEKLVNNPYTRAFKQKNEFVERAVRMPMALDSLRKGKTFDQTVSRLVRNHFDYSDLSTLDEIARRLIPFWIWTSRNVPLQITQQWANPAAYNVYDRLQKVSPVGGDIVMPKWISDWNPMALGGPNGEGGQWVITPDLPMVRLEQQLKQLTDPKMLLGQMSPIIKVPIELGMNRQLGIDVGEFQKPKQSSKASAGIDQYLLAPIAKALGGDAWVKTNAKGETVLDERIPYIWQNAMPVLAQLNRVTGGATGGKSSYGERQLGNIANWFGIPIRYVGPEQQDSEAVGRDYAIAEFMKQLVDSGEILSTKDLNSFLKAIKANPNLLKP